MDTDNRLYFTFPGGLRKAVTLSFDDGTVHDRRLVEAFNAHGLKATFNLVPGRFGRDGVVSRDEVAALYEGHEIASHGWMHLNLDRLQRLSVAALKQSQTTWLPPIKMMKFADFIQQNTDTQADKFIAWCDEHNQRQLVEMPRQFPEMILLIGPEGDFSEEEIALARESGYTEVKLGDRRLRTETAGLYGCLVASINILRK